MLEAGGAGKSVVCGGCIEAGVCRVANLDLMSLSWEGLGSLVC